MSDDNKVNIKRTLIFGIKYFVITIACMLLILSIGGVIIDARDVQEKVETEISETIVDLQPNQMWFKDNTPTVPDKYINEIENADQFNVCPDHKCNKDLEAMMIVVGICSIGSISILVIYIFSILMENRRLHDRYQELYDEMDEEDHADINMLFATRVVKKAFNPKLTIVLPIIISIFCIISTHLIIQQYGIRMSEHISGIIQKYGLEHSEEAMDSINSIDGIDVTINTSLHPNYMLNSTNTDAGSILSISGVYFRNMEIINHQVIPCGMIVCVKIDTSNYYDIILMQLILLIVYFIYFEISMIENKPFG